MERITRETIKVGQAKWNPGFTPAPPHSVIINGWPWFFRLKADNGVYPADAEIPSSDFVVSWQVPRLPGQDRPFVNQRGKPGRVYGKFDTSAIFVRFLSSVDPDIMHFFEVVPDNEQRARFDLDMSVDDLFQLTGRTDVSSAGYEAIAQLQQSAATVLRDLGLHVREDLDFTVCQSHGPDKQSYHLICNGFMHGNHKEAALFYGMVIEHIKASGMDWMLPFIDHSVYSTLSHFRPLFSTKPGCRRWKVIDDSWPITWEPRYERAPASVKQLIEFNRTIITNVIDCQWIPLEVATVTYPDFEASGEQVKDALRLLDECMPGHPFRYQDIDGPFVTLIRDSASHCPVCNRTHEAENPYIRLGTDGQPPTWYCRRSGGAGLPLVSRTPKPIASQTPEPVVVVEPPVTRPPLIESKNSFVKPKRDLISSRTKREMIHGKPRAYWLDIERLA